MTKKCIECGKEIDEESSSPYCTKCGDILDILFKSVMDNIIVYKELTENDTTILNKYVKEDIIKLYLKVYKIFEEEGDFTEDHASVLNKILKTFNISEDEIGKDKIVGKDKVVLFKAGTLMIEVRRIDSQVVSYEDFKEMRQAILDGKLQRTQEARAVIYDKKGEKTGKWVSVEKVADRDYRTQLLYRPIWAHTMRGMMIGWYVGFILKALDTAILYFQTNSKIGILWTIFTIASAVGFISKKLRWTWSAAVVVGFIAILIGGGNFWMGALAAGIISFLAAAPFGMAIGTIFGLARRRSLPRALDAVPEGAKPYILGILVPLVVAAVFIPFYLLWLNPMIIGWLSK